MQSTDKESKMTVAIWYLVVVVHLSSGTAAVSIPEPSQAVCVAVSHQYKDLVDSVFCVPGIVVVSQEHQDGR